MWHQPVPLVDGLPGRACIFVYFRFHYNYLIISGVYIYMMGGGVGVKEGEEVGGRGVLM